MIKLIKDYILKKQIEVIEVAIKNHLIKKFNAVKLLNLIKYNKYTCELCKKPIGKHAKKTFDHIIPKSKGGNNSFYNLQYTHQSCNFEKGNKIK